MHVQCMMHNLQFMCGIMSGHTCQLSHIMRESHVCSSKLSVSQVQPNFSRLTDKLEFAAHKYPILVKNTPANERVNLTLSHILSSRHKSVLRPCLEVRENLCEHLEAIGNIWSPSDVVGKSSVIIGRHWKIFGNLGYVKTKISCI